jgi:hypothetical protein
MPRFRWGLLAAVVLPVCLLVPVAVQADRNPEAVASVKRITPAGVGAVKLGMTAARLREQGLIGRLRRGCEPAGPDARSARLLAPLRGSVDFTTSTPRRARTITVRGGARARGVGIGARIWRIRAAFPRARVDHSTDQTFGITLVKVPPNGGGRIQFAVDVDTKRTTLIAVPRVPFCE